MNSDRFSNDDMCPREHIQRKWGDLTDDDLDKIEGSRKELVGKLQQKYGKSKEEAEREVSDFEKSH